MFLRTVNNFFKLLLQLILWNTFCACVYAADEASKVIWSGDLRYRVAKSKELRDDERSYQQLRARLALNSKVNEMLDVYARLATGTSATSTNQTLGDSSNPGMPRRSFGLDLAYFDWMFYGSNSHLWVGRTPLPFWMPGKNQLIFDSDLAFEGASLKLSAQIDPVKIFLNVGSSMISENYDSTNKQDQVDNGIFGVQLGASIKTDWGVGAIHSARYDYINIQDKNMTAIDSSAKLDVYSAPYDRFKGNAVYRPDALVANYFYRNKFELLSVGAEWKWQYDPFEITFFHDTVQNAAAQVHLSTAVESGLIVKWGRTQLLWEEVLKESESVVGAFTDSDANGGGTDNSGKRWSLSYQLSDRSSITYTQVEAERGIKTVRRDYAASYFDVLVMF